MPRCITSTSPDERSASRYLARRPSPLTVWPFEPLGEILRQRPAQVAAVRHDLVEARALHHGRKPAADGFDFGKFGHVLTDGVPRPTA